MWQKSVAWKFMTKQQNVGTDRNFEQGPTGKKNKLPVDRTPFAPLRRIQRWEPKNAMALPLLGNPAGRNSAACDTERHSGRGPQSRRRQERTGTIERTGIIAMPAGNSILDR